jgi:hypothetical protein
MGCLPWDKGCKCKNKCEGSFSHPGTVAQCKGHCKSSTFFKNNFLDGDISKEEFLCSGKWIDIQTHMLQTNTDPCPDDGLTLEDILTPIDEGEERREKIQDYSPILIAGGVFILILMLLFIWK